MHGYTVGGFSWHIIVGFIPGLLIWGRVYDAEVGEMDGVDECFISCWHIDGIVGRVLCKTCVSSDSFP